MVLCDPSHPVPVTTKFQAKIVVFGIEMPITKGMPRYFHANRPM
jgi:elongation factor 1 alpha-like protein